MTTASSADLDVIQQLRALIAETTQESQFTGVLLDESRFQTDGGSIVSGVAVIGSAVAGQRGYLVQLAGNPVALVPGATGSSAAGGSVSLADGDYITVAKLNFALSFKADASHDHAPSKIQASSGTIGGWEITQTRLESPRAAFIDAVIPAIGLGGATDFLTGAGFWVGRHNDVYKLHLGDPAGNVLTWNGTVLSLTGTVVAAAGAIGGWSIGAASLAGGDAVLHSSGYLALGTGNDYARLDATDPTYRLWIGNTQAALAPFRVSRQGALTASGVTLTGTMGSDNYSAGFSGWRITNEGNAEFNNGVFRGELRTVTLVKSEVHVVSGSLLILGGSVLWEPASTQ